MRALTQNTQVHVTKVHKVKVSTLQTSLYKHMTHCKWVFKKHIDRPNISIYKSFI